MAKTVVIYEKQDVIKFKCRGKVMTGKVVAKWARGEGDGYDIQLPDGRELDIETKNIVGLA